MFEIEPLKFELIKVEVIKMFKFFYQSFLKYSI